MSLPLPALLAQLRTAYPTATLLSELAAIESNTFVVRALVQMGSITLATGLAAAVDVEAAEDRAKCRAIEAFLPPAAPSTPAVASPLPLVNSAPAPLSPQAEPQPQQVSLSATPAPLPATAQVSEGATDTPSPDKLTDWDHPLRSSLTNANLDFDFDLNNLLPDTPPSPSPSSAAPLSPAEEAPLPAADLFAAVNADPAVPSDPPVNLADLNLTRLKLPEDTAEPKPPANSEKPARRKTAASEPAPAAPLPPDPPAEIDRSEEIARIGVEMKRLGWDTKKGRDHLQKTYSKRSRQELNDEELLDFLRYLEAQPSSAQMPF